MAAVHTLPPEILELIKNWISPAPGTIPITQETFSQKMLESIGRWISPVPPTPPVPTPPVFEEYPQEPRGSSPPRVGGRVVGGGGTVTLRNKKTGEIKTLDYGMGTQYRYGSAENDALYFNNPDWEVMGTPTPPPTPPVSPTPGVIPGPTFINPVQTPLAEDTYYKGILYPKGTRWPLSESTRPTPPRPPRVVAGSIKEWLPEGRMPTGPEVQRARQMSRIKKWLPPGLPQSTIPSPKVEYPTPGRPPEYNNPFAWKRKNSGWW